MHIWTSVILRQQTFAYVFSTSLWVGGVGFHHGKIWRNCEQAYYTWNGLIRINTHSILLCEKENTLDKDLRISSIFKQVTRLKEKSREKWQSYLIVEKIKYEVTFGAGVTFGVVTPGSLFSGSEKHYLNWYDWPLFTKSYRILYLFMP